MTCELLIKGGEVIDPKQKIHGIRDIAINGGKIADISKDISITEAEKVIDATNKIITPGLIDIHTHVAEAIMPIAVTPDEAGVHSGVTTVCDAGSTGYATFNAFKKLIIPHAQTDILSFLHLSPTGQAIYPEMCWQDVSTDRMLNLIEENKKIIKGIKIRAGASLIKNYGISIVKTAKKIAIEANIPLMVHIGLGFEEKLPKTVLNEFNVELLNLLEKGDILTHTFTQREGGVIKSGGSFLPELTDAMRREVVIDVAPAQSHFSFKLAKKGMERGVIPTTLSTDITITNYRGPVLFSLPVLMSKFLALGLSLQQVIEKTTIAPAIVLNEEERRGSLEVDRPADITILELTEGDFLFSDGIAGNTLDANLLLVPKLTLKGGVEIPTKPRFRNYTPGDSLTLTKGA
jgi:dihydroorotase